MNMVQQTPDGHVIVRSGERVYVDTPANFALDFGEAAPVLPPGAVDRIYEQGVRHPCSDGVTIVGVGDVPWSAGDRYIANIVTGLENQINRIVSAPLLPPPVKQVPMTEREMRVQLRDELRKKAGLK